MSDFPIRLDEKYKEVPVGLFQDHLDGLCMLIHYCSGLRDAGKGEPPGLFQLIMHYRTLQQAVSKQST
jgi:hypothetical protein